MVRHTSGYLCAPMPNAVADRLELPLMTERSEDPRTTAYTITVDAADRTSTGISAADRAHTLRVLADPTSSPVRCIDPGTSFRCARSTAACASVPATPRPRSTSCASPDSHPSASSASSSRTAAR